MNDSLIFKNDDVSTKEIKCRHNGKITYYKKGEGFPVILINAFGIKPGAWKIFIDILSKTRSVITWECRGMTDTTDHPRNSKYVYPLDEHSKDLKEILDAERINKADIITWSSGVKIGLIFNHCYPSIANSFTFIAGDYTYLKEYETLISTWNKGFIPIIRALKRNEGMAKTLVKKLTEAINSASTGSLISLEVEQEYKEIISEPFKDEKRLVNYCNIISDYFSYDVSEMINKNSIPTLVLAADNDIFAHPKQSEIVANKMKNAQYYCYADCGHWLIWENGAEIINRIESFWHNIS